MPLKRKDRPESCSLDASSPREKKPRRNTGERVLGNEAFRAKRETRAFFFPPTFDSHFLRNVSFFAHKAPVMQAN